VPAQLTADFKSIFARQLNVQEEEIETSADRACQTLLAVLTGCDRVSLLLQPLAEKERQRSLIFDEQYLSTHGYTAFRDSGRG
jgi:hypothetical protein